KYSRYCTPPCTTRTVGTPLCARRAVSPGPPRRGLCAVGWRRAHRRPRCDAGVSPRAARLATGQRLSTVHVIRVASFDLHLDGGVGNPKLPLDIVHDRTNHLLPLTDALLADDNMAAAGDDAGPDHPDVEIVDVEHTGHGPDRGNHGGHVGARRRP